MGKWLRTYFLLVFALCRICCLPVQAQHLLIHPVDKDTSFARVSGTFRSSFASNVDAMNYLTALPKQLAGRGYPFASVDSSWNSNDTLHAIVFAGPAYGFASLRPGNVEATALNAIHFNRIIDGKLDIEKVNAVKLALLAYYQRNGFPFAAVKLDSIDVSSAGISASLALDKGIAYPVDSIRVIGNMKIGSKFLQHYLDIKNGSPYNNVVLEKVDKRMQELPFLQTVAPSDITMLGSGAVLNVYVQPKKSSQVNFIVGFLPAANQTGKLQLTGDVNLDLKNLFGSAESILLKWQQLQPKSPRLNIGYDQPYIFNSDFGLNVLFDLFKKDSNYIQLNAQTGVRFDLGSEQAGRIFLQWEKTTLLSGAVDTNQVKASKTLPPHIDVNASNIGLAYQLWKTNYRFNPRSGNELDLVTSVGIKRISRNADILNIKDPSYNYSLLYDSLRAKSQQLRVRAKGAHYFPAGKSSTVKLGADAGWYSSPDIFRNDLFQIGGNRILRGFDEESVYAERYAVMTLEYRILISRNSYLAAFSDAAVTGNNNRFLVNSNSFISGGLGILYEAKAGLLNLSVAMGKRNDLPFNLRQAVKIHFGYINYF